MVGDKIQYLRENDTVQDHVLRRQGAVDVELPQTVTLKVIETEPGIKGATAAAQTKPATLETGLKVQVPSFIDAGRVDRRPDGGRASTSAGRRRSRLHQSPRTAIRGLRSRLP